LKLITSTKYRTASLRQQSYLTLVLYVVFSLQTGRQCSVALGWHAIELAKTSAIIEILLLVSIYITAVDMSFCTSLRNFIQITAPQKSAHGRKITLCRFSNNGSPPSGILWFDNGFFEKPMYDLTSYTSSIETIALKCLVFEKIPFLHFGDRHTNRQTDGQAHRVKPLSVSRAAV